MVAAIGVLGVIAHSDVRARRIPNVLVAVIAMLGLLRLIITGDPIAATHTFGVSMLVFTVGFILFCGGILGGGDAKLMAAMALLIGYRDLVGFLFLMSLCGGVLALTIWARDKLSLQGGRLTRRAVGFVSAAQRTTVPYGVAIAAAGVVTLVVGNSFPK
jgi:prepilin peptidase CpaA